MNLALGHKFNAWYLIFAQPYRTADSREISRLDSRGPGRRVAWSPRPRFWFNPKAVSGWERDGETLLDLLLSLDLHEPPLFAVVDHESGASKVEVLIPENKVAHYCEGCGRWEVAGDNALRWFMVRDDRLPGYLCPPVCFCHVTRPSHVLTDEQCHTKDWIGARAIRYLKRLLYGMC